MAAADTPAWRIKQAVVSLIGEAGLEGIPAERVYSRIVPDAANASFPCVQVCSAGQADDFPEGTTETYDWSWAWAVWVADRDGSRRHTEEPKYQDWRYQIMRLFREDVGAAALRALVPGVWRVELLGQPVFDEALAALPEYQMLACGFVLRASYRELK